MNTIATSQAPDPAGHYSQAIVHEGLVYISGQAARNPNSDKPTPESIEEQTRLTLQNLAAILEAAGSGMDRVLKVTMYLTDVRTWSQVNAVYAECFGAHRPARTTVPVPALRHHYRIEIDAIAALNSRS